MLFFFFPFIHVIESIEIILKFNRKKVQIQICGVKELSSLDPLHTEPKAHVEEEEAPEDGQKESKLPGDITEDNPVLGQPRS